MEQQVFKREGDPFIYLHLHGRWYYYDPNSEPLGYGAMGTVYLGFSCNSSERIAIKRIKDNYANNITIRERARQEASLKFSHPNIVKMLGICECAESSGPIFVLSSYVAGVTLDKHVKQQLSSLSSIERIEKISKYICCVLDALQYLHSKGVVHRDVKPSNIMLENGCFIKLMDLGVARLNGGNKYSSFGFIGTPQYAAPEQILRDVNNVDINGRTDIYSVGVTFYELLTGKNPFLSEVQADILSNQMSMKLPYDKRIPHPLYKVLLKATEKDIDKRYNSALELKNAIIETLNFIKEHPYISKVSLYGKILLLLIFLIIILIIFLILW